jgi:uncharacterized protein YjbJ (UPF0337 family)
MADFEKQAALRRAGFRRHDQTWLSLTGRSFSLEPRSMDKEHVKGAVDKAKGAVEDTAGKAMCDKKMQAEGKMDKAKGAAHSAVGDAKDAVKHAAK